MISQYSQLDNVIYNNNNNNYKPTDIEKLIANNTKLLADIPP
jgi:hypothetical protein